MMNLDDIPTFTREGRLKELAWPRRTLFYWYLRVPFPNEPIPTQPNMIPSETNTQVKLIAIIGNGAR